MKATHFTFVTHSLNKVVEAERILGINLRHCNIDLPEMQAIEVKDVAMHKVKLAYEMLEKQPVMIEDTGLFIEAWNGLPGALIKWFLKQLGDAGICSMIGEQSNRNAWAETIIAIYDGRPHLFSGRVFGQIAPVPVGDGGFGWDKIFIPHGTARTFGEMPPDEKDKYSMRRMALEKMMSYFSERT